MGRLWGWGRCGHLPRAGLHGLNHRLLGFGGTTLRLARTLLGLGDAVPNLLQAPLALVLLRLQLCQALGLGGAPFRLLGALLDLAQALLRLCHRALLRLALLLQALLGGFQSPGSAGGADGAT